MTKLTDFNNLRSAFSRVEASRGMAGVDGVTIREFEQELDFNLSVLTDELEGGRYTSLPLLRFLVSKRDGSPRALVVPCVRDRVAQAAVLNVIEPFFEAEFEDVSFAYRRGRSVKMAVYRIRELRNKGYRYVVEADIDSYFDNIDHDLLMSKVTKLVHDEKILALIEGWVRAEVYDGEKVYRLEKGIPQGTVISPMLANLFLDEFDETMISSGCQLVRYSDDFIILSKTCSEAEKALELTEEILEQSGLLLDEEDTRITDFSGGFKFLGVVFLRDSIFTPFDRPPKERRVIYMPPPFDLAGYLKSKNRSKGWQTFI